MNNRHIGFIGGGNMAQCLLRGMIAAGCEPGRLTASDPDPACRKAIRELGANAVACNQEAVDPADVVVLAVKPQVLPQVLCGIRVQVPQLLISICAGASVAGIAKATSAEQPIIRAMPNTPALLQAGVAALYANPRTSALQKELADGILSAVGTVVWVESEALLNAVTALSGSGPAYFFLLMESMMEAAQRLGLDAGLAATLTKETAFGAALMARHGDDGPAALRRQVTSPGGTTEAALEVLARRRTREAIIEALTAAEERSRQLAEALDQG